MSACKETRRGTNQPWSCFSPTYFCSKWYISPSRKPVYVLQLCGVCSSSAGGDKQEVVCERRSRFITGVPGEEARREQPRCAEVVLIFLRRVAASLFVLLLLAVTSQLSAASLSPPHLSPTTLTSISVFSCCRTKGRVSERSFYQLILWLDSSTFKRFARESTQTKCQINIHNLHVNTMIETAASLEWDHNDKALDSMQTKHLSTATQRQRTVQTKRGRRWWRETSG